MTSLPEPQRLPIRIKPDWNVKEKGDIVFYYIKSIRIKPDWNVKDFESSTEDNQGGTLE